FRRVLFRSGLSERHRPNSELLAHATAKALNERRINADSRSNLILGGFKRRLCAVPLGFEVVEPVLEDVIEVGYAVLDEPVEPLELVFRLGHFPLQRHDAAVDAFCLFGTASRERAQDSGEPLGMKS